MRKPTIRMRVGRSSTRKISIALAVMFASGGLAAHYGAFAENHPDGGLTAHQSQTALAAGTGETPNFATDPPVAIRANSYHAIAVAKTRTGEYARLFIGNLEDDGRACVGVRTSEVIGMACGVDLSGNVALQAHETTYRGHKMISGLVSAAVASIVVTNVQGHDIPVPIRNGTFFFDGGDGSSVRAYDDQGRVIGTYELERG